MITYRLGFYQAEPERARELIDAIAPMPARILSDEQAVLIPSVDREGRVAAVTVSSASIRCYLTKRLRFSLTDAFTFYRGGKYEWKQS